MKTERILLWIYAGVILLLIALELSDKVFERYDNYPPMVSVDSSYDSSLVSDRFGYWHTGINGLPMYSYRVGNDNLLDSVFVNGWTEQPWVLIPGWEPDSIELKGLKIYRSIMFTDEMIDSLYNAKYSE